MVRADARRIHAAYAADPVSTLARAPHDRSASRLYPLALPAVRMVTPPLPFEHASALPLAGDTAQKISALASGGVGSSQFLGQPPVISTGAIVLLIWAAGALGLFGLYAARHYRFCAQVREGSTVIGRAGSVHIVIADINDPTAFGVFPLSGPHWVVQVDS